MKWRNQKFALADQNNNKLVYIICMHFVKPIKNCKISVKLKNKSIKTFFLLHFILMNNSSVDKMSFTNYTNPLGKIFTEFFLLKD